MLRGENSNGCRAMDLHYGLRLIWELGTCQLIVDVDNVMVTHVVNE